jgi:alkanesulfonate monooxygenase SsuD/methylene tetrahydromethanopterin reductase-like flavin-dependent oxidoreductase (luciferase family)
LGLPYAFASHFAPGLLDEAAATYRRNFKPSAVLDKPHLMAGYNVFAADTDDEAELLASSQQQAFVAIRTGRHPAAAAGPRLPRELGPQGSAILGQVLSASAVGGPDKVARDIAAFVERTGVDELMITSAMFDHEARKRSLEITVEAMRGL